MPESEYSLASLEAEEAPFLGARGDHEPIDRAEPVKRSAWAVPCLLLQHVSSTFTEGSANFAAFLFLVTLFPRSLVPASLVGLATTASGLALAGRIGGMVDSLPRLSFVRRAVDVQKVSQAGIYCIFLLLFSISGGEALTHTGLATAGVWAALALIITASCTSELATTGLTVAVERDWVCTIAAKDSALLTRLNTYMRRIDLLAKLLAPLFVSLLTTLGGYIFASAALLGLSFATAAGEALWIRVVYAQFPQLEEKPRNAEEEEERGRLTWRAWARREVADWAEFVRLPVFGSSLAMATIYLTTLSYDGTFIAYVKAVRGWDDTFVAAMRGVCVLTGLLGTLVMPLLESRVGLERAGAWSLWSEVCCLLPSLVSFFVGAGAYGTHGPKWNSTLLFGGIALSRVGLWSFDLCQLKVLQLATDAHPRRNRLMALQIALQNLFNLAKYVVTLAAASPRQFKWTALVSWVAVVVGGIAYAAFLRSVRGHLVHLGWCKKWL